MKQIHKNIILSAGLLFASAGLMAQTDVEKTDTLAQKVNVAFRTVDRADLMGGESSAPFRKESAHFYFRGLLSRKKRTVYRLGSRKVGKGLD